MDKFVATVGIGGTAGIGAAATITVETKHTKAFIGNGASVTGDGQTTTGLGVATGSFGVTFVAEAAGSAGVEAQGANHKSSSQLKSAVEVKAPDVNSVDTNGHHCTQTIG